MTEPLGKIEKPEAGDFAGRRKLFIVPLLFTGEEAPVDYTDKFNLYWEQADQHLASLESGTGSVSHIYHESIEIAGEDGLRVMEKFNPPCYRIVSTRCQSGAVLEATEDKELAEECIDWERCILLGLISPKVAGMVSEFYVESLRKRYEHIARRVDETLKADEAGILFIREGHMVQFPKDIEVFSVAPPALDEIRRWQRQRQSAGPEDKQ